LRSCGIQVREYVEEKENEQRRAVQQRAEEAAKVVGQTERVLEELKNEAESKKVSLEEVQERLAALVARMDVVEDEATKHTLQQDIEDLQDAMEGLLEECEDYSAKMKELEMRISSATAAVDEEALEEARMRLEAREDLREVDRLELLQVNEDEYDFGDMQDLISPEPDLDIEALLRGEESRASDDDSQSDEEPDKGKGDRQ
jgi:archaellum component FlaC